MAGVARRRRLRAEESRERILEAAEHVLLRYGPVDLKFDRIALEAGISISTAHHHFGGIVEIQEALIQRMLERLRQDLEAAFRVSNLYDKDQMLSIVRHVYEILMKKQHSRLVAWLVLSAGQVRLVELAAPIKAIEEMIVSRFSDQDFPVQEIAERASDVMYRIAVSALGEGLIGEVLQTVLACPPGREGMVEGLMLGLHLDMRMD